MKDYTQLIEQLRLYPSPTIHRAADAIEALQARVLELQTEVYKATHRADSFETTNETLKRMKSALQDKLAALEKQEPVGWANEGRLAYMDLGYMYIYNKKGPGTEVPLYLAAGAQSQSLSDEDIVEIGNEVHRAMPNDADEQEELVAIVREVESRHGIGGSV